MSNKDHASVRAQQRCIPPLVDMWLNEFGEERYDGHGGVIRFFSKASVRAMERCFGRHPVRQMSAYLNIYKVESSRYGRTITVGHRTKRIKNR